MNLQELDEYEEQHVLSNSILSTSPNLVALDEEVGTTIAGLLVVDWGVVAIHLVTSSSVAILRETDAESLCLPQMETLERLGFSLDATWSIG